jgi:DNA-binding IscR family transcriptional regulator
MQKKKVIASRNKIDSLMDIPCGFSAKTAQHLSWSDILEIIQVPKGQCRLKLPLYKVYLLDVSEIVLQGIFFNACALKFQSCLQSCICVVHAVWVKAQTQLREILGQLTFVQLIKNAKDRDVLFEYSAIIRKEVR